MTVLSASLKINPATSRDMTIVDVAPQDVASLKQAVTSKYTFSESSSAVLFDSQC